MAWSPESSLPPVTDANSLSSVWRRFEWITCRIFLWEFFGSRNWWSKWGQKERLVLAQWRSSHWSHVIVYVFLTDTLMVMTWDGKKKAFMKTHSLQ